MPSYITFKFGFCGQDTPWTRPGHLACPRPTGIASGEPTTDKVGRPRNLLLSLSLMLSMRAKPSNVLSLWLAQLYYRAKGYFMCGLFFSCFFFLLFVNPYARSSSHGFCDKMQGCSGAAYSSSRFAEDIARGSKLLISWSGDVKCKGAGIEGQKSFRLGDFGCNSVNSHRPLPHTLATHPSHKLANRARGWSTRDNSFFIVRYSFSSSLLYYFLLSSSSIEMSHTLCT